MKNPADTFEHAIIKQSGIPTEDKAILDACETLIGQLETQVKFLRKTVHSYVVGGINPFPFNTRDEQSLYHGPGGSLQVLQDMQKVFEHLRDLTESTWARRVLRGLPRY
jgi:hypothetical protein